LGRYAVDSPCGLWDGVHAAPDCPLHASLADGTLPRQISYWKKFDLLIVDEFGLDYVERRLDPQAGHLLFKVIAARNGKSSTALGTNIEFDAWGEYLGDAPLAMALLDRVVDVAVHFPVETGVLPELKVW